MKELIPKLIDQGYLKTSRIIEAFKNIDRKDFIPGDVKDEAGFNTPLPIGWGQTISQPLTVAFMLELLQPKEGDNILDIGAGSGWQTSLLAYCVGSKGKIFAIERIPELAEFARKNIAKYNFISKERVELICADASKGWPDTANYSELVERFDKIICAAAINPATNNKSKGVEKIPEEWKKQLKIDGRLVTPIESSIWLIIKKSGNEFEEQEFPGFAFVPLIKNKNK